MVLEKFGFCESSRQWRDTKDGWGKLRKHSLLCQPLLCSKSEGGICGGGMVGVQLCCCCSAPRRIALLQLHQLLPWKPAGRPRSSSAVVQQKRSARIVENRCINFSSLTFGKTNPFLEKFLSQLQYRDYILCTAVCVFYCYSMYSVWSRYIYYICHSFIIRYKRGYASIK